MVSKLIGEKICLRALEPDDLSFLYELENDTDLWEVSNTNTPYSKYVLKQYLDNALRDIYEVKQLRLVICEKHDNHVIGLIDLFDFDPKNKRVGLGIVIYDNASQGKGYAQEAVTLICNYAFSHLDVHQVFANITADNIKSLNLFDKLGFQKNGMKKDWVYFGGEYKDEFTYQLLNE